jgi:uncharacterized protein with ParB-like and HNH nuclease domain
MGLQEEIDNKRQEIRSDSYSMSIGEWISLYENNEIDIHPEFQRFFRWTNHQKTSLIESLLLGIPIPPIFVSQRTDGVWDVVDGLQRLSTIYEFVGKLKDEDKKIISPLVLGETKYLPSLKGKVWEDLNESDNALNQVQRLLIKRSKIDVTILLKESDTLAKYELFQRLNTGGSIATPQEVRNCILVMYNRNMFHWMRDLSQNEKFQNCLSLTDRSLEEQYDMELLLRFLTFRNIDENEIRSMSDIGTFLTDKMVDMAQREDYNYVKEEEAFNLTFEILSNHMGEESFRRYDDRKSRFLGGFLVTAYEVVALGIGYNYDKLINSQVDIKSLVKGIWSNPDYTSWTGAGSDTRRRIPRLVSLGRRIFDV